MNTFDDSKIILHELTHILQRKYVDKFNKLYVKWGFEKASYIDNFNSIKIRERNNPDSNGDIYIWKNKDKYYWIGALYNNYEENNYQFNKNIKDVSYVAVEVYKINDNIFKLLENVKPIPVELLEDYIIYFNLYNNHYHPNEISAEYMTIENNKTNRAEAYLIFNNFLKSLDI